VISEVNEKLENDEAFRVAYTHSQQEYRDLRAYVRLPSSNVAQFLPSQHCVC
jgi:hypothetical protein